MIYSCNMQDNGVMLELNLKHMILIWRSSPLNDAFVKFTCSIIGANIYRAKNELA